MIVLAMVTMVCLPFFIINNDLLPTNDGAVEGRFSITEKSGSHRTLAAPYKAGDYSGVVQLLLKEYEEDTLEPSFPSTLLLSWILSTCPNDNIRDGKAAMLYACELHQREILLLLLQIKNGDFTSPEGVYLPWVVSASSHAELGNYEMAVVHQEFALRLTGQIRIVPLKESIQKRLRAILKLYQNEIPLRTNAFHFGNLSDDWCDKILNADDVKELDFEQLLLL